MNNDLREEIRELSERLETVKGSLTDFVNRQTLHLETGQQKQAAEIRALQEAIRSAQAVEDARHESHRQLVEQVNTNNQALHTVQELATSNSAALRHLEAELGDIMLRIIPLTAEVMGDRNTGKLSLREDWERRHKESMAELRAINQALMALQERTVATETRLRHVDKRHKQEDIWLKERPRVIKNALAGVFQEIIGNGVIRLLLAATAATGGAALLNEILQSMLGG